jgi:hypothetical protein
VQVRREWILKVTFIEGRQLPDQRRQAVVLEVNDPNRGRLVVGILVQPADLGRRRNFNRQGAKVVETLRLKLLQQRLLFLLRPSIFNDYGRGIQPV